MTPIIYKRLIVAANNNTMFDETTNSEFFGLYIYIYIWIYFTIIYRNYFFFLTATMRLQLLLIWQNKPWIFFFFEKLITRNTSFSTIPHQIWRKNVHFQWSSQIKIINEIDCSLKVYISVLFRTICPFFSYYI